MAGQRLHVKGHQLCSVFQMTADSTFKVRALYEDRERLMGEITGLSLGDNSNDLHRRNDPD